MSSASCSTERGEKWQYQYHRRRRSADGVIPFQHRVAQNGEPRLLTQPGFCFWAAYRERHSVSITLPRWCHSRAAFVYGKRDGCEVGSPRGGASPSTLLSRGGLWRTVLSVSC